QRLGESTNERRARGQNFLQDAALGPPRGAARELFRGGVPEDHVERAVHGDDGVGKAGEHRLEIHAARVRSGTAFMSSGARSPARSRSVPAAAIIAGLAVPWRGGGGGRGRRTRCSSASAASAARSGPLAATPPVRTTRFVPRWRAARSVRRTSIFTTAAWNDAATSATSASESGRWRLT